MEQCVKIPLIRRFLYYWQLYLYSRPLLTGFLLVLAITICMLIPLFRGNYLIGVSGYPFDQDNLRNGITNPIYSKLLLCTVFLSIPPLITLILDCWKVFSNPLNQHDFFSYLLLMSSYFLPNLILYVILNDTKPYELSQDQLYIWVIVTRVQIMAVVLGMLSSLFGHHAKYASNESLSFLKFSVEKRTVNILGIFLISAFFMMLNGNETATLTISRLLGIATFTIGLILLCTTIVRILKMLTEQALQDKHFRSHYHVSDFMYALCFTTCTFITIFFSLIAMKFGGFLQYVISTTSSHLLLICIVSIIPGMKFQKLAAVKHDQLETRLNLIRYVSHEMRTPLNTVSMGTSILKDEIVSVSGLKRLSMDSYSQTFQSNKSIGVTVPRPVKGSSQALGNDSRKGDKDSSSHLNNKSHLNNTSNLVRNVSDSGRDINGASDRIAFLGETNINRQQFVHAFKEMLETCQQVSESCTVAVSTLDDLLTFDKIDENKLVIEVEELNPWKLLLTTAKPFTINASLKSVKLQINLLEKSQQFLKKFCVRGDAFKLAQVIRNLLSNAIKFTPEGGTVVVALQLCDSVERGRCVRFSVKDSGAGISKQNMKKLFGQYVQFNAAQLQKGKGSGLGLWITKSKRRGVSILY
jgi:signal transduction histidine kinase